MKSLCLKSQALKTYGIVKVRLYAIDGDKWSPTQSNRFTSGERGPVPIRQEAARAQRSIGKLRKRVFLPMQEIEPRSSSL
jgi:hypothetical protein